MSKLWLFHRPIETLFFAVFIPIPATSLHLLSAESPSGVNLAFSKPTDLLCFRTQRVPDKNSFQILKLSDLGIMEISFHGERALVTGAGKGIGRALALKLAECGAEVIAISRTQSDLESLKAESPKIQILCLDISDWESTQNAIKGLLPIDLLVNNAGVLDIIEYGEYTEQDYDRTFNINVKAIVNIGGMIAKDMKARGKGGSIVNVSSVLAYTVSAKYGVYCATKGAVDQITRSMAVEFGPYNIRVNSVNPTVVRTRMAEMEGILDKDSKAGQNLINRTPLKRFAEPEDIVNPILFLLSDKASMVTGVTLPIDGGITVSFD